MRRQTTTRAPYVAFVALLAAIAWAPRGVQAQAEDAQGLASPRGGGSGVAAVAPVAPECAPAGSPVSGEARSAPPMETLALTYGVRKARRTAYVGFALSGLSLVLTGVWMAHAQPLGILEDVPARPDPGFQPHVDGGAIAAGAVAWISVIAFAPAIGRGGRFARMHPEVGRVKALRAVGWASYVGFIAYGAYLQTYGLVYTGVTRAQVGGAMALGVASLLLLSFDDLVAARQGARVAAEQGLARVAPLFSIGQGGSVVLGAQGRF